MKRLSLLLLGAACLLGCRKDDLLFVADDGVPPLTAMLRANAPAVQVFRFALNQPQALRTAAGATLRFPANAFRLSNGQTPATGQAELWVREIYTVPDMVLASMPTTAASGTHLVSGGEFTIQAWQGTTRLRLPATVAATGAVQGGLVLTSPVPAAGLDTTRMQLWQLPPRPFLSSTPDSSGWTTPSRPVWLAPATAGHYTVALPLDSIGTWNIDQFWHTYQGNSTANVTVEVPPAIETRVYFRPVGFNGLARCFTSSAAPTRWECRLPVGAPVVAVVLQTRGGRLYYATQAVTVQAGQVLQPQLQALSEAEIIRRIRQL